MPRKQKYYKYKSVKDLKSFAKMTPQQRQLMRRIKWTLSGERSFTQPLDDKHKRMLSEVSSVLAQMSDSEREKFIKNNWTAFEPVFENSERLRMDSHFVFDSDTANSLVDWMYNQVVSPIDNYEPPDWIQR